jgi:hypothetical protein
MRAENECADRAYAQALRRLSMAYLRQPFQISRIAAQG